MTRAKVLMATALVPALTGCSSLRSVAKTSVAMGPAEEERNAVVEARVYAVALQPDGDHHMVLGSTVERPAEFMTAEVTRPPSGSADRAALRAARGRQPCRPPRSVASAPVG